MSSPLIVEYRVACGADDAEKSSSGLAFTANSDLERVNVGAGTGKWVGIRFTDIDALQGEIAPTPISSSRSPRPAIAPSRSRADMRKRAARRPPSRSSSARSCAQAKTLIYNIKSRGVELV